MNIYRCLSHARRKHTENREEEAKNAKFPEHLEPPVVFDGTAAE